MAILIAARPHSPHTAHHRLPFLLRRHRQLLASLLFTDKLQLGLSYLAAVVAEAVGEYRPAPDMRKAIVPAAAPVKKLPERVRVRTARLSASVA